MSDQRKDEKLSVRASILVWTCLSIVGWAALAGIGYSIYSVGGHIIARYNAPAETAPAAIIAEPSDREIGELRKVAPAAGPAPKAE